MIVEDVINKLGFQHKAGKSFTKNNITGIYCCDMLSWVMSHAKQGNVWITVQTHINIVAIASLLDLSCIIIPENGEIDEDTIEKANEEDILIFSTNLNSYKIFCKFYEIGLR